MGKYVHLNMMVPFLFFGGEGHGPLAMNFIQAGSSGSLCIPSAMSSTNKSSNTPCLPKPAVIDDNVDSFASMDYNYGYNYGYTQLWSLLLKI